MVLVNLYFHVVNRAFSNIGDAARVINAAITISMGGNARKGGAGWENPTGCFAVLVFNVSSIFCDTMYHTPETGGIQERFKKKFFLIEII